MEEDSDPYRVIGYGKSNPRPTVEHNRGQTLLGGGFVHTIHTPTTVITEYDADIMCVHMVQLGDIFGLRMVKRIYE